jgi:hypothetical protein
MMETLARVWDLLTATNEKLGRMVLDKTGDDARRELAAQTARCADMATEFTPEVIARTQRYIVRLAAFTDYHWYLFTAYDGEGNVIGQVKDYGY